MQHPQKLFRSGPFDKLRAGPFGRLRAGSFWRSALVVLFAATLATLAVRAWTGPTAPPAGGNPAGSNPPFVTSLPGSPTDGQEVVYQADATNNIYWRLKYKTSATKWMKIGGPPLTGFSAGDFVKSQTADIWDVDTVNSPAVTVPLTGSYRIQFSTYGYDQASTLLHYFRVSPATSVTGGTLNAGTIAAQGNFPNYQPTRFTVSSEGRAALNAGNVVRLYRYLGGGGSLNVSLYAGVLALDPLYVQ